MVTRHTEISDLPCLLRVEEVAHWANVSCGVVYEAIKSGQLASVRLGRLVRVPRTTLEGWMQVDQRGAA